MTSSLLRNPIYLAIGAIGALILMSMSVNVVPETQQAIISSYGKVDRIVNPYKIGEKFGETRAGLTFRIPFSKSSCLYFNSISEVDL